jgi:hypothetical protein
LFSLTASFADIDFTVSSPAAGLNERALVEVRAMWAGVAGFATALDEFVEKVAIPATAGTGASEPVIA